MKKRNFYLGMAAATAVFGGQPLVAAAQVNPYEAAWEAQWLPSAGKTKIYAADVEYGWKIVTAGIAVTLPDYDDKDWAIDLILQDPENVLPENIWENMTEDKETKRYPLARGVNGEIFLNGNNLASCFQIVSNEDALEQWKEMLSPENGWIYVDKEFLMSVQECLERLPNLQEVGRTIDKWEDLVSFTEDDSEKSEVFFHETTIVAMSETLDELWRKCRAVAGNFMNEKFLGRFEDDILDAMLSSGKASSESTAEMIVRNLTSVLDFRIARFFGYNTWLNAVYNGDSAGWLLNELKESLEGNLEIEENHIKMSLTANNYTVILEAGGSERLVWGRVVRRKQEETNGELLVSFVFHNDAKEKGILLKDEENCLEARVTLEEKNLLSVYFRENRMTTPYSGEITVNEDGSVTLTGKEGYYGLLKSIKLYSTQEKAKKSDILEVAQSLDLDTLAYRITSEIMKTKKE